MQTTSINIANNLYNPNITYLLQELQLFLNEGSTYLFGVPNYSYLTKEQEIEINNYMQSIGYNIISYNEIVKV